MIIINGKAYYTEREDLPCFYARDAQEARVIRTEYKYGDPDNKLDQERFGNSIFFVAMRTDGRYLLFEEFSKWILPKGISPYETKMKQAIMQCDRNFSPGEEWINNVTATLNQVIQENMPNATPGKVKKIYIDYPAFLYNYDEDFSRTRYFCSDGYDKQRFRVYDPETDIVTGTSNNAWILDDKRDTLTPTSKPVIAAKEKDDFFISPSIKHTQLVYPDKQYWHNDYPILTQWIAWINNHCHDITYRNPLDIPTEVRSYSDLEKQSFPVAYESKLSTLTGHIFQLSSLLNYNFGILLTRSSPISPAHVYDFTHRDAAVSIALFAGDYIKIPKTIEMDTQKDNWFDMTYSALGHAVNNGMAAVPWMSYMIGGDALPVTIDQYNFLTIGHLNSLTEAEYLENRPAVVISAIPITRSRYNEYVENNSPIRMIKLNTEPYIYQNIYHGMLYEEAWNIYSEILMPLDIFHLKGDDTLYNGYAFGKKLKHKTRFHKSPVFNYPLFTGYFSHSLRYNEGIIIGK